MHHYNCNCPQCSRGGAAPFEMLPFGACRRGARLGPAGRAPGLSQPFSQAEEMELATELLSLTSEAELEQFLGGLFKSAWKGIKRVGSAVSKVAGPLGGVLKGLAKTALPMVGGALGSFIPIPGVGTALGTALGGAIGRALEMEGERMDQGELELEAARRFVRIAGTAAQLAAQNGIIGDADALARRAVLAATRVHLPQLSVIDGPRTIGRWRLRRLAPSTNGAWP